MDPKKRYVMLYAPSGELIALYATHEEIHHDQETNFTSFTDVEGNHIKWNGLVLESDQPIRIHDKPEVTKK